MENEEHYAAMEEFCADVRNIRFIENHSNWAAIMDFLTDHELETTPHNLRFAFLELSAKDGLLELEPIRESIHSPIPAPQSEPAPTPTTQPAPVVPVTARTFRMYRNGKAIEGTVRSL